MHPPAHLSWEEQMQPWVAVLGISLFPKDDEGLSDGRGTETTTGMKLCNLFYVGNNFKNDGCESSGCWVN